MVVTYTLNNKKFKDYGVHVSRSKGFGDVLKRRAPKSYEWAEYHGASVDLSEVKYEPREIELDCWIKGNSWQDLINQFHLLVRDEFAKPGTQRLLVEVGEHKPLAYEVYMTEDVQLEKRFKSGEMVGVFTLKLIEPNPIKKVLKLVGTSLDLSYNSTKETEISYGDGTRSIVPGNASITEKTLPAGSIIVIAGNIEEITNLTTNATVLWEKL